MRSLAPAPHRLPALVRPALRCPVIHWVVPVSIVLGALALRVVAEPAYLAVVREDGPVEWLTFAGYLVAAVLAVGVAMRLRRRGEALAVAFVVLAVGLTFVAGEEISWGQRQLGFEGPAALVERNHQDEANLHNLVTGRLLHGAYIVIGLYGAGAGRWLAGRFRPLASRTWLVAPPPALAWYFLVPAALYVYYDYVNPFIQLFFGEAYGFPALRLARLQEAAELAMALGFALFVLGVRRRLSEGPTHRAPLDAPPRAEQPALSSPA